MVGLFATQKHAVALRELAVRSTAEAIHTSANDGGMKGRGRESQ